MSDGRLLCDEYTYTVLTNHPSDQCTALCKTIPLLPQRYRQPAYIEVDPMSKYPFALTEQTTNAHPDCDVRQSTGGKSEYHGVSKPMLDSS